MFREVAEKSEGVMFRGGKKVWLPKGVLSSAQSAKEAFVGGEV